MATEAHASRRSTTKLIREGEFVAELEVALVETEGDSAPYMALESAYRLDDLRAALCTELRSATWNVILLALPNTKTEEFGYMQLSMRTDTISLSVER